MRNQDSLAVIEPRDKPDIDLMIRELRGCVNQASGMGVFEKLEACHLTRICWWSGQSKDGRYGKPAKDSRNLYWWEGAPETRRLKADEIIKELSGTYELVNHRGQVTVSPTMRDRTMEGGSDEDGSAESWQLVLDYYRNTQKHKIDYAWRSHSTCVHEFGYSIIHTAWRGRQRLAMREITEQQAMEAVATQVRDEVMSLMESSGMPMGENGEIPEEMLAQVQIETEGRYNTMLTDKEQKMDAIMLIQSIDADISDSEAKEVLKQLARGEVGIYYAPEDDGGVPDPIHLTPWVNVLHLPNMSGDGDCDMYSVPEWVTEVELRARAESEGWNMEWVEKVLTQPNVMMPELYTLSLSTTYSWVLNGAGIGLVLDQTNVQDQVPVFQIFHRWGKSVNRAGLTMIYRTVLHPMINDSYGIHECTKYRDMPFMVSTSEPVINAMLARGVGQRVIADQNQVIDLMDGEGARAQLGSNPPLLRGVDQHVPVRPGMQMHTRQAGMKPINEFMNTPQVDQGALVLIDIHERNMNQLFFRDKDTDADVKQQQRELNAYRAMDCLTQFWKMMWKTIQANVTQLRVNNIAGRQVNLYVSQPQLQGDADIQIGFNVSGLSGDSSDKWLATIEKLAGLDRAGRIDWGALVEDVFQTQNPAMAKKIVMSGDVATARITDEQENRIAKIMAGVPVDYPERASNPQLRLEVMKKWMAMPNNIPKAMSDPTIGEMMQKEMEYLNNQIEQYQTNPIVGRSLQTPNA